MRYLLGTLLLLAAPALRAAAPKVVAVNVDGVVHPITVEILGHAIELARQQEAAAILLRLNTPGGLLEATRQLNEKIVASPMPVLVFVTPSGGRAASAGFFLLQAGDIAAMAPGTNTGAASPILLSQEMDQTLRRKVENDAAAQIRSLAAKRGRNAALAETAVLEAKSFTEQEALSNKLIDLVAPGERALLDQCDGRVVDRFNGQRETLRLKDAVVVEYQKTLRENFVSAISDPNLAFIMLILGALGVYIEFTTPGVIVPGVAGGILVLLGLSALSVLPINWLGAGLLILALALFVLEAKIASHGVLGTGGAVAMVLGAMVLIDAPPELRIRFSTALAVALPFAFITTFLVTLVLRARANKVVTGAAGLVGETGSAHTALAPAGKVFVHGEFWDAESSAPVEKGARVRVIAVDGLRLRVEPAP